MVLNSACTVQYSKSTMYKCTFYFGTHSRLATTYILMTSYIVQYSSSYIVDLESFML